MVFYHFRLLDMRRSLSILLFLSSILAYAQTGLYNSGNIRIHDEGNIGFHTHLINESSFDENEGLAGFYGNTGISVSGAFIPIFFDLEIANDGGVDLFTSVSTTNNTNFVVGDFRTPRVTPNIGLNFINNAFYVGEGDPTKVDGYAIIEGVQSFIFPVGDLQHLRPLTLNSIGINTLSRCAYFFEDPNNPSFFPGFNTALKETEIARISILEFWHLEGSQPSIATLTWNNRSAIGNITTEPNSITVVGWHKSEGRWTDLGNAAISGDLDSGFVTSLQFVPDDYSVLTLGSLAEPVALITLDNFILTPNGDGINDFLDIPQLLEYPDNSIQIFDRRGLKVFEMENYSDEFTGVSNVDNMVLERDLGLPEGVYFYLVTLNELELNYQGYLYLQRY